MGRRLSPEGVVATHHLHELFVDHLDELVRTHTTDHLGTDGFLTHLGNEILHHRKVDIGFEQSSTHVLQGTLNVGFADGVLAFSP